MPACYYWSFTQILEKLMFNQRHLFGGFKLCRVPGSVFMYSPVFHDTASESLKAPLKRRKGKIPLQNAKRGELVFECCHY